MLTRSSKLRANCPTPILLFIVSVPCLVAQQYCVSGAITSVASCNNCNFHVGDAVAMTFNVAPGDATCTGTLQCIGHSSFSATIGGRNWVNRIPTPPET